MEGVQQAGMFERVEKLRGEQGKLSLVDVFSVGVCEIQKLTLEV